MLKMVSCERGEKIPRGQVQTLRRLITGKVLSCVLNQKKKEDGCVRVFFKKRVEIYLNGRRHVEKPSVFPLRWLQKERQKGGDKKENAGGEASNAGRASRATKEGLVTKNDYSGEKAAQCSYMRVRNKPWWPRQSTSVLFAMPPSPGESKNKKRKN